MNQEISLKRIYDGVSEDIFDMSNVIFFLKKMSRKNGGCLYFVMFSVSRAQKGVLCYSKIYVVMLLWYRMAGISRKLESDRKQYVLCPYAAHLNSYSVIHAWYKNLKQ